MFIFYWEQNPKPLSLQKIDIYLGGDGIIELGIGNAECGNGQPDYDEKREAGFVDLKRVEVPSLPLNQRQDGFSEVELGDSDEQVKTEMYRCLQCDLEICLAKQKRTEEFWLRCSCKHIYMGNCYC